MSNPRNIEPQILPIQAIIQKAQHKSKLLNNIPLDIKKLFIEQASNNTNLNSHNTNNIINNAHSNSSNITQNLGVMVKPPLYKKNQIYNRVIGIAEGVFSANNAQHQATNMYSQYIAKIKSNRPIPPSSKPHRAKSLNTSKTNLHTNTNTNANSKPGKINLMNSTNYSNFNKINSKISRQPAHTVHTTRTAANTKSREGPRSGKDAVGGTDGERERDGVGLGLGCQMFDHNLIDVNTDAIITNQVQINTNQQIPIPTAQNKHIHRSSDHLTTLKRNKIPITTTKNSNNSCQNQQQVQLKNNTQSYNQNHHENQNQNIEHNNQIQRKFSQYQYQFVLGKGKGKSKGFRKIRHNSKGKQQVNAPQNDPNQNNTQINRQIDSRDSINRKKGLYKHLTISTNQYIKSSHTNSREYINSLKRQSLSKKLSQQATPDSQAQPRNQNKTQNHSGSHSHNNSTSSKKHTNTNTQQINQQIQDQYQRMEFVEEEDEPDGMPEGGQEDGLEEEGGQCYGNLFVGKKGLVQMHKRRLEQLNTEDHDHQYKEFQQSKESISNQVQQSQQLLYKYIRNNRTLQCPSQNQQKQHQKPQNKTNKHKAVQPIPQFVMAAINQTKTKANPNPNPNKYPSPTKNPPQQIKYHQLAFHPNIQKNLPPTKQQQITKPSACVQQMKKKITYNKITKKSEQSSVQDVLEPKATFVRLFEKQKSAALSRKNSEFGAWGGNRRDADGEGVDGEIKRKYRSKDKLPVFKEKGRKCKYDEQVKGWDIHEAPQFADYY